MKVADRVDLTVHVEGGLIEVQVRGLGGDPYGLGEDPKGLNVQVTVNMGHPLHIRDVSAALRSGLSVMATTLSRIEGFVPPEATR